LMATKGFAAPEVEQTYTRAWELCLQGGAISQHFPVLWGLWQYYTMRGLPSTAHELGQQLLNLALGIKQYHLGEMVTALVCATRLHQFRREAPRPRSRPRLPLPWRTSRGLRNAWLAAGNILQGWAVAVQGHVVAGVAQIHKGLAAFQATGAADNVPYWLALLAEGYGHMARVDEGLQTLREALTLIQTQALHFWEAELYRLQGALPLIQAAGRGRERTILTDTAAEGCFRRALAIARRQQAKSLELRAALSLARLWQRQAQRSAARRLLAEIYGWFTEGHDTADLQEARVLLRE
jgi:tetratricopeptide (TPR) repeat protein